MKLNSRLSLFAAVLVAGVFSGCGPGWKVLKASDPTAIGGANNVALAFDYSQMKVEGKSVDDFKAAKMAEDPKYADTWADLTAKFETAVLEGLKGSYPSAHMASMGGGDVTVTIRPTKFGMGKYIVVSSWPTTMDVVIGAKMSDQAENSDEIQLVRSYPASVTQPSVFNHIPYVGQQLGAAAGKFLSSKKK